MLFYNISQPSKLLDISEMNRFGNAGNHIGCVSQNLIPQDSALVWPLIVGKIKLAKATSATIESFGIFVW